MLVKTVKMWLFLKLLKIVSVYVVIITSNTFKDDFIHNLKIFYKMGSNLDKGTTDFCGQIISTT